MTLVLSEGSSEPLDAATLRVGPDDALWCDVREGRVPARFDNHATQQLAARLDEDAEGLYFNLSGSVVRPPHAEDPMAGWTPDKGHV